MASLSKVSLLLTHISSLAWLRNTEGALQESSTMDGPRGSSMYDVAAAGGLHGGGASVYDTAGAGPEHLEPVSTRGGAQSNETYYDTAGGGGGGGAVYDTAAAGDGHTQSDRGGAQANETYYDTAGGGGAAVYDTAGAGPAGRTRQGSISNGTVPVFRDRFGLLDDVLPLRCTFASCVIQ